MRCVVQTVVSLKDCVDVQVYGSLNKWKTSAIEGSLLLSLYLGLASMLETVQTVHCPILDALKAVA